MIPCHLTGKPADFFGGLCFEKIQIGYRCIEVDISRVTGAQTILRSHIQAHGSGQHHQHHGAENAY